MKTPQAISATPIPPEEREMTATIAPQRRQIVCVRQRRYLVEDVVKPTSLSPPTPPAKASTSRITALTSFIRQSLVPPLHGVALRTHRPRTTKRSGRPLPLLPSPPMRRGYRRQPRRRNDREHPQGVGQHVPHPCETDGQAPRERYLPPALRASRRHAIATPVSGGYSPSHQ